MSDASARQPEQWGQPQDQRGRTPQIQPTGEILELRAPDVFVTVGTDHHPFDRLITWIDAWSAKQSNDVLCLIQYGTSTPPIVAQGTDYLPRQRLDQVMAGAGTFVTHGGPATIAQCWELGSLPIVVPRDSGFGEHVDNHQVRFAERMAGEGRIALARSESELSELLDERMAGVSPAPPHRPEEVAAAVTLLGEQIDALVASRSARRFWRRGGRS